MSKLYKYQNPCCAEQDITLEIEIDKETPLSESQEKKIERMLSRALDIANTPYPGDFYPDKKYRDGHGPAHCVRQYLLMDKMIEILPSNCKSKLKLDKDKKELIKMAAFCMSLGRLDEQPFNLATNDHSKDNANVFKELAIGVGFDESDVNQLAEAIRLKCNPDPDAKIEGVNEEDKDSVRVIANMMTLVHEADLYRIQSWSTQGGEVDKKFAARTDKEFIKFFTIDPNEQDKLKVDLKAMYKNHKKDIEESRKNNFLKPIKMELAEVKQYILPAMQGPAQKSILDKNLEIIIKAILKKGALEQELAEAVLLKDEAIKKVEEIKEDLKNLGFKEGINPDKDGSLYLIIEGTKYNVTDIINSGADFTNVELDEKDIDNLKKCQNKIKYYDCRSDVEKDKHNLEKYKKKLEENRSESLEDDYFAEKDEDLQKLKIALGVDIDNYFIDKDLLMWVRQYTYKLDKIINPFLRDPTDQTLENLKTTYGSSRGGSDQITLESMLIDAIGLTKGIDHLRDVLPPNVVNKLPRQRREKENLSELRGYEFTNSAPTSTSLSEMKESDEFGKYSSRWDPESGVQIGSISVFSDEEEVLYQLSSKFRKDITGVFKKVLSPESKFTKEEYQFRQNILININSIADQTENIDYNINLNRLDLSGVNLGSAGAKLISDVIKQNKTIKYLNLTNTNISYVGVKDISGALKENTTLKILDLSGINIRDRAHYIADALKENISLTHLYLSNAKIDFKEQNVLIKSIIFRYVKNHSNGTDVLKTNNSIIDNKVKMLKIEFDKILENPSNLPLPDYENETVFGSTFDEIFHKLIKPEADSGGGLDADSFIFFNYKDESIYSMQSLCDGVEEPLFKLNSSDSLEAIKRKVYLECEDYNSKNMSLLTYDPDGNLEGLGDVKDINDLWLDLHKYKNLQLQEDITRVLLNKEIIRGFDLKTVK